MILAERGVRTKPIPRRRNARDAPLPSASILDLGARSRYSRSPSAVNTTVLISGAGIAGPALAFWLNHHGIVPTLVERAPALRTGGYIIDFWGLGYDIAEKMGVLPEILTSG